MPDALPSISDDVLKLNPQLVGELKTQPASKYHNVREEADLLTWVIQYARLRHWRVAHFRGAWSKDGKRYMTPVQGDGKGFPDLCLVRDNRLIFAELKSAGGIVSEEQYEWLEALGKVVPVYIWRPSDRDRIEKILL